MHNILTIGGGSGQYALLAGLRELDSVSITAVVSMVDSGGSTGRLRDELGILPPGDVLKCILALSPHRDIARAIFLKRFTGDRRLTLRYGDIHTPHVPMTEPLRIECEHFVHCVAEGKTPLTDGRSGVAVVQVLEAAQRSLEAGGGPVPVEPV